MLPALVLVLDSKAGARSTHSRPQYLIFPAFAQGAQTQPPTAEQAELAGKMAAKYGIEASAQAQASPGRLRFLPAANALDGKWQRAVFHVADPRLHSRTIKEIRLTLFLNSNGARGSEQPFVAHVGQLQLFETRDVVRCPQACDLAISNIVWHEQADGKPAVSLTLAWAWLQSQSAAYCNVYADGGHGSAGGESLRFVGRAHASCFRVLGLALDPGATACEFAVQAVSAAGLCSPLDTAPRIRLDWSSHFSSSSSRLTR